MAGRRRMLQSVRSGAAPLPISGACLPGTREIDIGRRRIRIVAPFFLSIEDLPLSPWPSCRGTRERHKKPRRARRRGTEDETRFQAARNAPETTPEYVNLPGEAPDLGS